MSSPAYATTNPEKGEPRELHPGFILVSKWVQTGTQNGGHFQELSSRVACHGRGVSFLVSNLAWPSFSFATMLAHAFRGHRCVWSLQLDPRREIRRRRGKATCTMCLVPVAFDRVKSWTTSGSLTVRTGSAQRPDIDDRPTPNVLFPTKKCASWRRVWRVESSQVKFIHSHHHHPQKKKGGAR